MEAHLRIREISAAFAAAHPLGVEYVLTPFDQRAIPRFLHRLTKIEDLPGFFRRALAECSKKTLENALEKLNDPAFLPGPEPAPRTDTQVEDFRRDVERWEAMSEEDREAERARTRENIAKLAAVVGRLPTTRATA